MSNETQCSPVVVDTGRSVSVLIASVLFGLARLCLALVFAVIAVACILLAIAATFASVYDIESLRPIVSWMPGMWSELPPEAYVFIYAFAPSFAAWLILVISGKGGIGDDSNDDTEKESTPREIVVDGVRYREVE